MSMEMFIIYYHAMVHNISLDALVNKHYIRLKKFSSLSISYTQYTQKKFPPYPNFEIIFSKVKWKINKI